MKNCLITFRSITPAQRGERLLRHFGFDVTLQRTPKWMQEQGCGYSLRIKQQEASQCLRLLREDKVPFRKAYLLLENGAAEELLL